MIARRSSLINLSHPPTPSLPETGKEGEQALIRHQSNQRYWDAMASDWQKLRDQDGFWRLCPKQPELAFDGEALAMIYQYAGDLHGKQVCVIGSGDNYVAFALAGMGAQVTSSDISARQLAVARERAEELGLEMTFLHSDSAALHGIAENAFDLVCSSNGFFVWIAEPEKVFRQVYRVLKPGGYYIFYDVHPFLRPWRDQVSPLEMERPYTATGPFEEEGYGQVNYQFHWRMSDLLNPLLDSGLILRQVAESPAGDARFWEGMAYLPGEDPGMLDWRKNPRAGLPTWLTVAAQKPQGNFRSDLADAS
jgi:ubiquinone/menaquinone biosynthesis C-methylase UbiE